MSSELVVPVPRDLLETYLGTMNAYLEFVKAQRDTSITIATEPGTYVIQVPEGGGFVWQSELGRHLEVAVDEITLCLAEALGFQSSMDEDDDEPYANDADAIRAMRQSYPVAATVAAIAEAFGVRVPGLVADALTDCEPLPDWQPRRPPE